MAKLESSNRLRVIGLIVSVLVGLIFGVISYIWPNFQGVATAFLIALIIFLGALALEILIKLSELGEKTIDNISNIRMERDALAQITDDQFHSKYHYLKDELKQLNDKLKQLVIDRQYHIPTLQQIYDDDRISIEGLSEREKLLSTCPMAKEPQKAIDQINTSNYKASIAAHLHAVTRKVDVVRIYLFDDRKSFDQDTIKNHLIELAKSGLTIRVLFRDEGENPIEEDDFLVFGNTKVSVGKVNQTRSVESSDVYYNPSIVSDYTKKYGTLVSLSHPIQELVSW